MLPCTYACHTAAHDLSRRAFLGTTAALGLAGFASPAAAKELTKQQKRVVVIFLEGGLSQLESWDPKPNTDTGGPFKAIQTSVPGTRISELLPLTAKQMHKLAIVRSLNSQTDDHGQGHNVMLTGRKMEPGITFRDLAAGSARLLSGNDAALPGHIRILPKGGSGFNGADAAFLGPKFASVGLGDGKPPADLFRPANLTAAEDEERDAF